MLTEIADFLREEKGILSITPLQRDILSKDTRLKMFGGRKSFGMSNIQNIPRDHQEG